MKSVTSALISAAVLGQVGSALTVGSHAHHHTHVHHKRTPAAEATWWGNWGIGGGWGGAPSTPDTYDFLSPEHVKTLKSAGIKLGCNKHAGSGAGVAVGKGGEYVVELNNKGKEDIIIVAWSGSGQWGAVNAGFVGAAQADVTHTLKAGTSTWISYNPSKYNNGAGGDISGALAPIYPGGGLTKFSGQVDDTWVEFTFTNDHKPSATDVSRLINMHGHKVEVHNYAGKSSDGDANCSSTMDACSFVCPDGASNCIVGKLLNCPVGGKYNVASADGMDGGCGGLGDDSGYVEVNFY